ncbi:MAG: hypothetical protein ACRD2O_01870 [Terriglobia bacterium]
MPLILWAALTQILLGQQGVYWKAEVREFDFAFGQIKRTYPRPSVYPGAGVTRYRYQVYQEPGGRVRKDLLSTTLSRNGGILPPIDVTLIDFANRYELVYDKGAKKGVRSVLTEPARPTPLEPRQLLGQRCEGERYQWRDARGNLVRVDRWTATDSDFKLPLFELTYSFEPSGDLGLFDLELVTALKIVPSLPSSLFEPPSGLSITTVAPTPVPFL